MGSVKVAPARAGRSTTKKGPAGSTPAAPKSVPVQRAAVKSPPAPVGDSFTRVLVKSATASVTGPAKWAYNQYAALGTAINGAIDASLQLAGVDYALGPVPVMVPNEYERGTGYVLTVASLAVPVARATGLAEAVALGVGRVAEALGTSEGVVGAGRSASAMGPITQGAYSLGDVASEDLPGLAQEALVASRRVLTNAEREQILARHEGLLEAMYRAGRETQAGTTAAFRMGPAGEGDGPYVLALMSDYAAVFGEELYLCKAGTERFMLVGSRSRVGLPAVEELGGMRPIAHAHPSNVLILSETDAASLTRPGTSPLGPVHSHVLVDSFGNFRRAQFSARELESARYSQQVESGQVPTYQGQQPHALKLPRR